MSPFMYPSLAGWCWVSRWTLVGVNLVFLWLFSFIWGQLEWLDVNSMADMEQVKQVANLGLLQRGKKKNQPCKPN